MRKFYKFALLLSLIGSQSHLVKAGGVLGCMQLSDDEVRAFEQSDHLRRRALNQPYKSLERPGSDVLKPRRDIVPIINGLNPRQEPEEVLAQVFCLTAELQRQGNSKDKKDFDLLYLKKAALLNLCKAALESLNDPNRTFLFWQSMMEKNNQLFSLKKIALKLGEACKNVTGEKSLDGRKTAVERISYGVYKTGACLSCLDQENQIKCVDTLAESLDQNPHLTAGDKCHIWYYFFENLLPGEGPKVFLLKTEAKIIDYRIQALNKFSQAEESEEVNYAIGALVYHSPYFSNLSIIDALQNPLLFKNVRFDLKQLWIDQLKTDMREHGAPFAEDECKEDD